MKLTGGGIIINQHEMLHRPVGRLLFKLSFPAMTGMAIYSLLCLAETFFVSRLGEEALAAVTLTIPVQVLLTAMASAAGTGLTSLISRTLGGGNSSEARNISWHGFFLAVFMGLLFWRLGVSCIDKLLIYSGCTSTTFALSKDFLLIILSGSIFTFLAIMMGNVIQGEGDTAMPMLIALAGVSINVIIDPFLMFGLGVFPVLGLNGVAAATVVCQVCSTIFTFMVLKRRNNIFSWSLREFSPSWQIIRDIFRVGLPALVMEIASLLVMVLINRVLVGYGCAAVAVMGIFVRIRSLLLMPVLGLAQGTMPIVGFAYGARRDERVKETLLKAAIFSLVLMMAAWLPLQCSPAWLMRLFSQDVKLVVMGADCLRLATLILPILGPLIILSTVLQAVDRGMKAMWLSVLRQLVFFLPLLYVLPGMVGLKGVWLSFAGSELLAAFLGLYFLVRLWNELTPRRSLRILTMAPKYTLGRLLVWLRF
ncbi:MATE family efflux transporter [Syntrophomonas palmitatica]|uniref:MATE family efflux transporter n=1 Tax=Syntrophomonas palmitatica TaxID=402877 RepID=UPI000A9A7078|nr:MATE family efflux transporter [Syntrophomonas palmitatica]